MQSPQEEYPLVQLWNQAATLHQEGRWNEATQVFTRIIELAPEFAPAYVQRGLIIHELGNPEKAFFDFEHAIQIDPQYGMAYYGRGWVKHTRGDFAGELEDARRGLLLDNANAGMYFRRIGAAQSGLGQHQAAIDSFNTAIELNADPDEGTIYNRGLCLLAMEQYTQALADFDRCLELDPDWAWALTARSKAHAQLGNYDQAIADCTLAIAHQPTYADSYMMRGLLYDLTGDTKRAQADFKQLRKLATGDDMRQLADGYLKKYRPWWPF